MFKLVSHKDLLTDEFKKYAASPYNFAMLLVWPPTIIAIDTDTDAIIRLSNGITTRSCYHNNRRFYVCIHDEEKTEDRYRYWNLFSFMVPGYTDAYERVINTANTQYALKYEKYQRKIQRQYKRIDQ